MLHLYVITQPELGWDCVVAVFPQFQYTKEQLEEVFPEDFYVIHEKTLEYSLDGYR